jgi:hypothetical protein
MALCTKKSLEGSKRGNHRGRIVSSPFRTFSMILSIMDDMQNWPLFAKFTPRRMMLPNNAANFSLS